MGYKVNNPYFVYFTSTPGLTLSSLTVIFLVNGVASTLNLTLTHTVASTSVYVCSYTPVVSGSYYLELLNGTTSLVTDVVYIEPEDTTSVVSLTQNYGYSGRFQIPTSSPTTTRICIYNSTDWAAGNTSSSYLINSTGVDAEGNWLTTPITVIHGVYTIVQIITSVSTTVLAAYMVV